MVTMISDLIEISDLGKSSTTNTHSSVAPRFIEAEIFIFWCP
jgi:hypothetical protein